MTIEPIRERLAGAGIFLDFDGTLAEIALRPEEARAVDGVGEALDAVARRALVVAIVTGRPSVDVLALLEPPESVQVFGLYGLEAPDPDPRAEELVDSIVPILEAAAAEHPGAWVERKGLSVAVHVRQTADPDAAEAALLPGLVDVAADAGLQVLRGKRVIELAAGRPSKGALVERVSGHHGVTAVLYAGDDLADLDAFDALDRLAGSGVAAVRVAVRGAETPHRLVERADLVVDGPAGLLALLRELG